jgi:dipeptide/tripeptide permease
MTGLVLLVIGTGLFKPGVSVMVGQLHAEDDPRRDPQSYGFLHGHQRRRATARRLLSSG